MNYKFRVELKHTDPLVWREIVIPQTLSLYQLHMVIQAAFGWENSHLFQFTEIRDEGTIQYAVPHLPGDEEEMADARTVLAKSLFKNKGETLTYIYDFGDHWEHTITLLARTNRDYRYDPACLAGAGACPPEDVGGIVGYKYMLEILNSSHVPEKLEFRQWLGLGPGEEWNASFFSLREASKRIGMLLADYDGYGYEP